MRIARIGQELYVVFSMEGTNKPFLTALTTRECFFLYWAPLIF